MPICLDLPFKASIEYRLRIASRLVGRDGKKNSRKVYKYPGEVPLTSHPHTNKQGMATKQTILVVVLSCRCSLWGTRPAQMRLSAAIRRPICCVACLDCGEDPGTEIR